MFTAVLFLTAKTGNNPNVHQQEMGREDHVFDGILCNDRGGGSTHTVRWESQEAYGHVRKEQRNEVEGSMSTSQKFSGVTFFLLLFLKICVLCYYFHNLKNPTVLVKKQKTKKITQQQEQKLQWSPEEPTQ